MGDEDFESLVVDNGSGMFKLGFGGDDSPSAVFPTSIGRPKYSNVRTSLYQKEVYIGDRAQVVRGMLDLKYPIEHGVITNWDDMEKIWHYGFYNELRVAPEEHAVLVSDVPLNPISNREYTAEIMFETFQVRAAYLINKALLALYASGRTTGCVVGSGDGVTYSVPIYQNDIIPHATERMNFGGRDITDYLTRIVNERCARNFSTSADREIMREIKHSLGYVSVDFDRDKAVECSNNQKSYCLPDGNVVMLNHELFQCAEVLFRPSLMGGDFKGIHQCVHDTIQKCDATIQQELMNNILLAGGNTMFSNIQSRMNKELINLAPEYIRGKIVVPPERRSSVWIGGSIFVSLSSFPNMWISKQEYDENGVYAIHTCI